MFGLMYLTYHCPKCDALNQSPELSEAATLQCGYCDWVRDVPVSVPQDNSPPNQCLRCGNEDLWRQKNFSQAVGLGFVALAALISSIAWMYYRPILAISILMAFAVLDMVLYVVMPDVLVCYRCRTKHHGIDVTGHKAFDHELAEKYRQEEIRLKASQ